MQNNQIIPVFIGDDKFKPTEVSPHIYFFNGIKQSIDYYINYQNTDNLINKYPYFDIYDGQEPSATSKSLLFYNEDPLIGTKPDESLYTKFWSKYISTLYNEKTRLLEANAIIPLNDYIKLTLNDIIEFRGNYYHLRSINDYNLGTGECTIELLGPIESDSLSINLPNYIVLPNVTISSTYSYQGYSITVSGNVSDEGSSSLISSGFVYSTTNSTPTLSDTVLPKSTIIGNIYHTMTVTENINYYFRAYAQNSGGVNYSATLPVKVTVQMLGPSVSTYGVTNITVNDATFNGEVFNTGQGTSVLSRGFCWDSINQNPTISNQHQAVSGTIGTYSLTKTDEFIPGTTYYVRAYAQNSYGYSYGETKTFVAIDKEYTLYFRLHNQSNYTIPEFEFFANSDGWVSQESFVYTAVSGQTDLTYQFSQKIKNSYTCNFGVVMERYNNMIEGYGIDDMNYAGIAYISLEYVDITEISVEYQIIEDNGSNDVYLDVWVIDKVDTKPTVTLSPWSYSGYSVTINGNVTDEGSEPITERGFVFSNTNTAPTIYDSVFLKSGTTGPMTHTWTVFDNIHYYVRSFATNAIGTSYSPSVNNILVKSSMLIPQGLTTSAVTNITYNDATFSGYIASQGASSITQRGFVYNTTGNPTISNNKVIVTGTTGSLSKDIFDTFSMGTTYYVKTYATNSYGTAYGNQVSFTPQDPEFNLYVKVYNSAPFTVENIDVNFAFGTGSQTIYENISPGPLYGSGWSQPILLTTKPKGSWICGVGSSIPSELVDTVGFDIGDDHISFAYLSDVEFSPVGNLENFYTNYTDGVYSEFDLGSNVNGVTNVYYTLWIIEV